MKRKAWFCSNPTPLRRSGGVRRVVDLLAARRTTASPRGGAQGWSPYLAPHPSARQGQAHAARRSPAGRERRGGGPPVRVADDTRTRARTAGPWSRRRSERDWQLSAIRRRRLPRFESWISHAGEKDPRPAGTGGLSPSGRGSRPPPRQPAARGRRETVGDGPRVPTGERHEVARVLRARHQHRAGGPQHRGLVPQRECRGAQGPPGNRAVVDVVPPSRRSPVWNPVGTATVARSRPVSRSSRPVAR